MEDIPLLRGNDMAEPTYEELKARLAELEKQGPRRTGSLEFRVSEKGGVSVYGLGRFPSHVVLRTMDAPAGRRRKASRIP
jgi:hypothetical protein